MKRFFLLLIWFALPFLAYSYESFSLWPLMDYEEEDGTKKLEILGPFLFWEKGPDRSQWGLRPLLSGYIDQGKACMDFLYPLGKFEQKEEEWRGFFFPVFKAYSEKDSFFFSIFTLFWGRNEKGGTYGGLFPFYGTMEERRGKRKEFLLWPFFGATYEKDSAVYKFFWPFFKFYEGETQGLDIWPFFSHRESNRGSSGFVFWPFYVWREKNTELGPFSLRACFPIYAHLETPFSISDFLFPPFFYHQSRRLDGTERFEFWPFWALDAEEVKFWPLWRHLKKEGKKRIWVLWPLYSYSLDSSETERWETERFFTLWHREKREEGKERSTTVFWPLFCLRHADGEVGFIFPSLIPLEDEGVKRNIIPLLSLVEYQKDSKGFCFDLGWGFFKVKKKGEMSSFRIAFLAEGEFQKGYGRLRFLLRLFGLKKDPGGKWKVRILDFL